ncbi:beta-lactamase/transpeptidase-like protein [Setomelanomma holmii]|uniref:Beta-lactamase/transpeptidase-like protein n=1 Tax=Setomelanomma holmii TaxID=210430 RepID=A0A9P4LPR9_9PLEO|nr:beta-lactamase/transpeptidase-like protein [Setomelanomma holmii]
MVLLYTFLFAAVASAGCYEASIAHPLPNLDPKDAVLKETFASISTALTAAAAAPEFDATSFSVEITSSKESLWSQHHTARKRNATRPDVPEVNGDALYRIASITKTFTVLGILYQHEAGNLSLDDPIDKYIEELRGEDSGAIPWKDITLRSLASQLSGLPRECRIETDEGTRGCFTLQDLGLPPVSRDGLLDCDEYSPDYEKPCTARDLLDTITSKSPLFAPNMKSTYSNVAYELLGLALERVTKQTYRSYMNDAIFEPLGMSKSAWAVPSDSAGVIPLQPHYWDVDPGIQDPTGGIYSSTTDMSKYLRYVLTHYNAIATGVNWLHPVSPAEGLHSFYGMPWEIFHTDRALKDSKRTVRFITKGGSLPGYFSIIAVVPEYDLGITMLIAGEQDMLSKVLDSVGAPIVRAAEEVAIRQLHERYAGTYTTTNRTLNSTITLVADTRGLVVERFISNGTNVLEAAFTKYNGHSYAQLTPTLLFRDEKKQRGELWRMVVGAERIPPKEPSIWDDFCPTNIETGMYAGVGFNELVFWDKEKDGQFGTVELSAFRVNMTRTDEDEGMKLREQTEL